MASLPQRQPSQQRRQSPHDGDHRQESRMVSRTDSEAFSTTSEDSQTLLLNRRPSLPAEDSPAPQKDSQTSTAPPPPAMDSAAQEEPRKCWICFSDETEDDETTSEWRSPCPCALTAHESCLLDWIADIEAPSTRRRAGGRRGKILCPQCKSEIHLARPRSLVVEAVRVAESLTGVCLLPGVGFSVCYTLFRACIGYGISSIYVVFGLDDARRILAPLEETIDPTQHASVLLAGLSYHLRHWRLEAGLGMIPVLLIASRTRLPITDHLFPILPVMFFTTNPGADEMLNSIGSWPPSAALSFGLLPFVRAAYNTYYDKVWAEREKRWSDEIKPRAGEHGPGAEGDAHEGNDMLLDDNILEINVGVEMDMDGDWEDEAPQHQDEQAAPGPAVHPPVDQAQDAHAGAPNAQDQVGAPAPPQGVQNPPQAGNLYVSTTHVADTILGALVFPSIAAAVGEILRLTLPKSWVTIPSSTNRPTGLLQQRWGRSLVGGCLFVTVKDAIMLYVRWRLAQNHRKRKVLDWDKQKQKLVNTSPSFGWGWGL